MRPYLFLILLKKQPRVSNLKCSNTVLLFALSIISIPSFGEASDLVDKFGDNPLNWCRSGGFATVSDDYQIGRILQTTKLIHDTDGNTASDCPSEDLKKCRAKETIINNTVVVVSKDLEGYSCVYDVESNDSGWVQKQNISFFDEQSQLADWEGTWSSDEDTIK